MLSQHFKIFFALIMIPVFVISGFFVFNQQGVAFGQIEEINLEELCAEMCEKDKKPEDLSDDDYQKILETCRKYYEEQSAAIEKDISKTAQEKKTLQNEIYFLRNKINKLNNDIHQSNLMIKDLGVQIIDTSGSIDETSLKILDSQEKLVHILRTIYEEDQKSIIEILLSESELSGFFNNLVSLEALGNKNKELLGHIKSLKTYLDEQKGLLDTEKGELEDLVVIHSLQKQESASTKEEQEYLLVKTKGEEVLFQKHLEEVEARRQQIMARSMELIGVADAPSFGEAIELAKRVGNLVGIRPAFLLAIISQESAIGRNVGQCYVTNKITGGGIYKNGNPIERIIHRTRDLPILLEITGDNFAKTPVSCWIPDCVYQHNIAYHCKASVNSQGEITCAKNGYVPWGFGGAMGPAQFIPSTWNGIKDKVQKIVGHSPNPWNVTDAFTASGLFLHELGAGAQTRQKEINAASRYYGGSSSYALQVLTRATCIQNFMDEGTMSSTCESLILPPK
jgi:peptidoglycan hydrolase CwlO-like protein